MRRFIRMLLLLVLPVTACTFEFQTFPQGQTETPASSPAPAADAPAIAQALEGAEITYKGIRFRLDPALGSRLYVYDEVLTLERATAHYTRFGLNPEEYCQTWCLMVYPVAEFEQAFGSFIFPPGGYRGGAAIVFKAQEKALAFQNGSGERALETFGQDIYGVINESLKYAFRGYSADKQYGVYVQVPTRAASLPDAAPTMTTDIQALDQYNRQASESMNVLTPGDFTTSLDLLDALVASIRVETP